VDARASTITGYRNNNVPLVTGYVLLSQHADPISLPNEALALNPSPGPQLALSLRFPITQWIHDAFEGSSLG
jgi:hypothetical protein